MLTLLLALTLVAPRITQPAPAVPATSSGGGGYATIQEDGTPLTQRTTLNFTGSPITCSDSGGITVCNVAAGGGAGNFVEVEVDFGAAGDTTASVVVTGQAWVGASSIVVCAPTLFSTTDRTDGQEDAVIEGLTATPHTRSAGVGFTLVAHPANGRAVGKFKFHCTGG